MSVLRQAAELSCDYYKGIMGKENVLESPQAMPTLPEIFKSFYGREDPSRFGDYATAERPSSGEAYDHPGDLVNTDFRRNTRLIRGVLYVISEEGILGISMQISSSNGAIFADSKTQIPITANGVNGQRSYFADRIPGSILAITRSTRHQMPPSSIRQKIQQHFPGVPGSQIEGIFIEIRRSPKK